MSPHRTPHIPKHPGENTHTKTSSHPKISSCFQIQRRGCPRGRRARPLEYTAPAATAERFSPLTKGVKNNHESSSSSSKRRRTIPGNRRTRSNQRRSQDPSKILRHLRLRHPASIEQRCSFLSYRPRPRILRRRSRSRRRRNQG